jgi:hypothetical protein
VGADTHWLFRLDVIDGWWCADLPGIAPRQSALKIRDPGIAALHILGDRAHPMTQAIVATHDSSARPM